MAIPYEYDLPSAPLRLKRSLSYENEAYNRAIAFKDECEEGDTVMMNYFINKNGYVTATYLKKENGDMIKHEIEACVHHFPMNWTFDSSICPIHLILNK